MDNKLDDIERQGHETAGIMRGANQDLLAQRGIIQNVADKNKNIQDNLKAGKKVINAISKTEFRNRAILYATIFLLFITDLILVAYMIAR